MLDADELDSVAPGRSRSLEIDRFVALPKKGAAKKAEVSMALQLIDSMAGRWQPKDFHDTYTDRVNALIEQKKAGKEVTVADPAPEPTNVTDLFEVLKRSVENAQKQRATKPPKKTATKKTATNKTTAKKPAAEKPAAKKPAAKKTSATKTSATKTSATKTSATKTSASKAAPKKKAS